MTHISLTKRALIAILQIAIGAVIIICLNSADMIIRVEITQSADSLIVERLDALDGGK